MFRETTSSHLIRGCVLVGASLLLAFPSAAGAAEPAAGEPNPNVVREDFAKVKAENKVKDKQQKEEYLKAIPYPGGLEDESDLIKTHALRNWYLLTYPTGTMPAMPWTKARRHNNKNVEDAEVWPGEGLVPPGGPGNEGGPWDKAVIAPLTNVWTSYGPQPLDSVGTTNNAYRYGLVAGRVAAGGLAVDPTNPAVAYAGFVAGGVWKTTNLGSPAVVWTPLWDDKDYVVQSAGAIEIDPTNNNVVYVGTGDWAANDQFSEGIMKTTDGGLTWTHLAANVFTPYSPVVPAGGNRWGSQNIRAIKVDPKNPNRMLAGTRFDLYITHDGGTSWEICGFGANYTNPSVSNTTVNAVNRISSIVLDSRGTNTVAYVAVGYLASPNNGNNGVYRFTMPTSGCPSSYTLLNAGFPAGTGNGTNGGSLTGRVELASSIGSDGGMTLYAQVSRADNQANEGTYVLRPDGGSTTWTKLSGSTSLPTCSSSTGGSSGQDWYDLFIAVNPTNDKDLYIGHIDVYRATVNSTYTSMTQSNLSNVYTTSCPSYGKVHPDQHTFAFVPGTNGTTFLLGNDGGIYYNNASGATANWKQLNDTINTTQFYAGQIGKDFANIGGPQWWAGGMQDNGNGSWDSSKINLTSTGRSVGGDGFFFAFDPLAGTETAGWWFSEYTYGSMYCSRNSGADGPFASGCGPNQTGSADWSAPFVMDTLHCTNSVCRNLIFGEDYVHAAGAFGTQKPTWRRVSPLLPRSTSSGSVIALNYAPSEPKSAVAGTSDGKLWWSENVYTGTSCTHAAGNTASFSCSPNMSATWRDADSTNAVLPNRAILGVAADPTNHRMIYAAVGGFDDNTPTTPGHVFQFTWNGSAWTRTNKTGNLPDVPASGIVVNPHNRKQVFLGTYFGFYYTDDIDAASPVWVRYQWGLPNTVIKYLTVDRGPAATPYLGTTLMAFTYGRGVYAIKLPTTGSFPAH